MKYADNLFARRDPRPLSTLPNAAAAQGAPVHPAPHPAATPLAPAAPAPEPVAARAEEPGGSKLIVGPNVKLKGVEIDDCDTLVVEGRIRRRW